MKTLSKLKLHDYKILDAQRMRQIRGGTNDKDGGYSTRCEDYTTKAQCGTTKYCEINTPEGYSVGNCKWIPTPGKCSCTAS